MIRGILFRQALEKFLKSPVAQNARVQVCLPNGEFYDIKEIKLSLSLLEARNFVTRYLMKLNFTKDLASCSLPPVA
jgi:hypothetical protein